MNARGFRIGDRVVFRHDLSGRIGTITWESPRHIHIDVRFDDQPDDELTATTKNNIDFSPHVFDRLLNGV